MASGSSSGEDAAAEADAEDDGSGEDSIFGVGSGASPGDASESRLEVGAGEEADPEGDDPGAGSAAPGSTLLSADGDAFGVSEISCAWASCSESKKTPGRVSSVTNNKAKANQHREPASEERMSVLVRVLTSPMMVETLLLTTLMRASANCHA